MLAKLLSAFILIAKFIGFLALALVIVYGVAVYKNWEDVAPSSEYNYFQSLYENRPKVAPDENVYVFSLGADVKAGHHPKQWEPMQRGKKRLAWYEENREKFAKSADYSFKFPDTDDFVSDRTARKNARKIWQAIESKKPNRDDVEKLSSALADWEMSLQDKHQHDVGSGKSIPPRTLMNRYDAMLEFQHYQTALSPFDNAMSAYFVGSNLVSLSEYELLRTYVLLFGVLENGNNSFMDRATEILDNDMRFWRSMLAQSDSLIFSMLCANAIAQNFEIGTYIFAQFPPEYIEANAHVPKSWQKAFTEKERNLEMVYASEIVFMQEAGKRITSNSLTDWIMQPLQDKQDTININAKLFASFTKLVSLDYPSFAKGYAEERAKPQLTFLQKLKQLRWRNPEGKLYQNINMNNYKNGYRYQAKINDIEGIRRMALLTAELSAVEKRQEKPNIAHLIKISTWHNPYSEQPFEWDKKARKIVFNGMDKNTKFNRPK